ncbi:hypothetical protein PR202_ga22849 [Eleusine coracana subsp. coracana]|uniref:Uncharacterized protein n=1 Tax=Eleusine coracana subsp. coracana TaxID=191504 RepID=A0AAV5D3R3_ELECO|nr:hypothetical protein PR202_ga22849 [Eleusine coracana subsp. coracana]
MPSRSHRVRVRQGELGPVHLRHILLPQPGSANRAVLEAGHARAQGEYREWAGRLGVGLDVDGNRVILLNDAGARFVEATADVTRFACGSIAVSYTMQHMLPGGPRPMARGARPPMARPSSPSPCTTGRLPCSRPEIRLKTIFLGGLFISEGSSSDIIILGHRVHFTREMISKLKSQALSSGAGTASLRTCSTMQCVMALTCGAASPEREATTMNIAVNGRGRMKRSCPRVPDGYTGNVVLWAHPTTTVLELLAEPLSHVVDLISREVARIDDETSGRSSTLLAPERLS